MIFSDLTEMQNTEKSFEKQFYESENKKKGKGKALIIRTHKGEQDSQT